MLPVSDGVSILPANAGTESTAMSTNSDSAFFMVSILSIKDQRTTPIVIDIDLKKQAALDFYNAGNLQEARQTYLEIYHETDLPSVRAAILSNLAMVERADHNHLYALLLLSLALPLAVQTEDCFLIGNVHNGFGVTYEEMAEKGQPEYFEPALRALETAARYYLQINHANLNCVENNIAFLLINTGRAPEAFERLDNVKRVFAELNEPARVAEADHTIAQAYAKIGDTEQAVN
jgi:tetratricopeptide (TPR) repeat protein